MKKNIDKACLTIRDYKKIIDDVYFYYFGYWGVINELLTDDIEGFNQVLTSFKDKDREIKNYQDLIYLCEDVYFDLEPRELDIFYNYGMKVFNDLVDYINSFSYINTDIIDNEQKERKFHDAWFKNRPKLMETIILPEPAYGFTKRLYTGILDEITRVRNEFEKGYKLTENPNHSKSDETTEDIIPPPPPVNTISFKSEYKERIIEILEPYFPNQTDSLKKLIETGACDKDKLTFIGCAGTLADFFNQLRMGQILIVGIQKNLENWIIANFFTQQDDLVKEIKQKTITKVISEGRAPAEGNRLIDIKQKNGKFEIIELPLTNRKKANNY